MDAKEQQSRRVEKVAVQRTIGEQRWHSNPTSTLRNGYYLITGSAGLHMYSSEDPS